jgi:hypothetical protein
MMNENIIWVTLAELRKDNTKVDPWEIGWNRVQKSASRNRVKCWAFLHRLMHLRICKSRKLFDQVNNSYISKDDLYHGVNLLFKRVNKTSFPTSLQPIISNNWDKYLVKLNDTVLKTVQNCLLNKVWLTIISGSIKHYPLSMTCTIMLFYQNTHISLLALASATDYYPGACAHSFIVLIRDLCGSDSS